MVRYYLNFISISEVHGHHPRKHAMHVNHANTPLTYARSSHHPHEHVTYDNQASIPPTHAHQPCHRCKHVNTQHAIHATYATLQRTHLHQTLWLSSERKTLFNLIWQMALPMLTPWRDVITGIIFRKYIFRIYHPIAR